MVSIEISHAFTETVGEAFSYITDTANWPDYWPDFVRLEHCGDTPWGRPGARLGVVIRFMGRDTALNIELERFEENAAVEYVSRQQGFPELRHERYFAATPGGCEFRLRVSYAPRGGWCGLFDRLVLRRGITKALRKTLNNLDRILQPRDGEG